MSEHKTVFVRWEDEEAWIDEEIAPLIRELWKAGFTTLNSCQENRPGWVWIQFLHASDAETFLNIVARYEKGVHTFYNRIRQEWTTIAGELEGEWEYDVHPMDMAVEEMLVGDDCIKESCTGPSDFIFTFSIRFPKTDLPLILRRVRRHNKNISPRERIGHIEATPSSKTVCRL